MSGKKGSSNSSKPSKSSDTASQDGSGSGHGSEWTDKLNDLATQMEQRANSIDIQGRTLTPHELGESESCRKGAEIIRSQVLPLFEVEPVPHFCRTALLPPTPRANPHPRVAHAVLIAGSAWPLYTTLKVCVIGNNQKGSQLVSDTIAYYNKILGGSLTLVLTSNRSDSDIRVDFEYNDGHYSYVGTDNRGISKGQKTMNLDPSAGNFDLSTSKHEFGHAVGLAHEHQNPKRAIVWNEDKVIADMARPPNRWSPEETRQQIIDSEAESDVILGTIPYDPRSIMHYVFQRSWIQEAPSRAIMLQLFGTQEAANAAWNALFVEKADLSEVDVASLHKFYPPSTASSSANLILNTPVAVNLAPASQKAFYYTPTQSGTVNFKTIGVADTVLTLIDDETGAVLAENDDSSTFGLNAHIIQSLVGGRKYRLVVRLYSETKRGSTKVMAF